MNLPLKETSIRARELGFKQETINAYVEGDLGWVRATKVGDYYVTTEFVGEPKFIPNGYTGGQIIAAPTLDEILEELPKKIKVGGDILWLRVWFGASLYSEEKETFLSYCKATYPIGDWTEKSPNPAEAALQLWNRLKEEGLA